MNFEVSFSENKNSLKIKSIFKEDRKSTLDTGFERARPRAIFLTMLIPSKLVSTKSYIDIHFSKPVTQIQRL